MVRRTLSIALLALAAAAPLAAQRPNTREGFWISLGGGFGAVNTDCQVCRDDWSSGGAAYLRLGGTLSPRFLLGGESAGWFHSAAGVKEALGFASVAATLYPSRTGAFFLKLGIGGMSYRANDGIAVVTARAPSGSLGAGYDIRMGRNVSLTPFVNGLRTSPVTFKLNGVTMSGAGDIKINLVQLGVGVTWH